jgi:hypothetical protein
MSDEEKFRRGASLLAPYDPEGSDQLMKMADVRSREESAMKQRIAEQQKSDKLGFAKESMNASRASWSHAQGQADGYGQMIASGDKRPWVQAAFVKASNIADSLKKRSLTSAAAYASLAEQEGLTPPTEVTGEEDLSFNLSDIIKDNPDSGVKPGVVNDKKAADEALAGFKLDNRNPSQDQIDEFWKGLGSVQDDKGSDITQTFKQNAGLRAAAAKTAEQKGVETLGTIPKADQTDLNALATSSDPFKLMNTKYPSVSGGPKIMGFDVAAGWDKLTGADKAAKIQANRDKMAEVLNDFEARKMTALEAIADPKMKADAKDAWDKKIKSAKANMMQYVEGGTKKPIVKKDPLGLGL